MNNDLCPETHSSPGMHLGTLVLAICMAVSACDPGTHDGTTVAQARSPSGLPYSVVSTPQALPSRKAPVTVTEIFSYGCGGCFIVDEPIRNWRAAWGDTISFTRVPSVWSAKQRAYGRLYYTLETLG